MRRFFFVLLLIPGLLLPPPPTRAAEPRVVSVGGGSYAEFPPGHEGEHARAMALDREIFVDPAAADRPIPTNDWWTDLLLNPYAGAMWANPLTVSCDERGLNIFYPTDWGADGQSIGLGPALRVQGLAETAPDTTGLLIADFEGGAWPAGWSTTGTAFGAVPATGTFPTQGAVSGFLGQGLVNTYNPNDSVTGTLTSAPFTIERDYIHLLVGGGNHPGLACAQLKVGNTVMHSATGLDSEQLLWRTWDVSALKGQTATLEILDLVTGGWGHILVDHVVQTDEATDPARLFIGGFAPADARALDWSDWLVSLRMRETEARHIDATLGHGLPYVWIEPHNVEPLLVMEAGGSFFGTDGAPVALPAQTDCLGIEMAGRYYGVFLPDGTIVRNDNGQLAFEFASQEDFMVIGLLPGPDDLAYLRDHAFAIPRSSQMDWTYDPVRAEVTTTWQLQTEPLKGDNLRTIQGWRPHHTRLTRHDIVFNGLEYTSPRGAIRCATGTDFTITWPFAGLVPHLPAPKPTGRPNDYIESRMRLYLADYTSVRDYANDSYWSGKDVVRWAKYMAMADSMNDPSFVTLRVRLREALEDWMTYTPSETEHYFAAYPQWRALVGFDTSFGSVDFNDHHFHYGYLTLAAAMLGAVDAEFLQQYGPMATLIAREYANWDRTRSDFPFMRTFDLWGGHSYAAGISSPVGNNQESSSEAIQSWVGLFMLGEALGDDAMTAAGAMGYAMESAATMEYWFDDHGDVFPANYRWPVVGILQDWGQAYATYFSADPAWIYGIQWLPVSPMTLHYLSRDPEFARGRFESMMADRQRALGATEISSMGAALGNVVLGHALQFDPDWVCEQMDALYAAEDPVARETYTGGLTYYYAHAMRDLGRIDETLHLDTPTGSVFYNTATDTWTAIAWNPSTEAGTVRVMRKGVAIAQFVAEPGSITRAEFSNPNHSASSGAWQQY